MLNIYCHQVFTVLVNAAGNIFQLWRDSWKSETVWDLETLRPWAPALPRLFTQPYLPSALVPGSALVASRVQGRAEPLPHNVPRRLQAWKQPQNRLREARRNSWCPPIPSWEHMHLGSIPLTQKMLLKANLKPLFCSLFRRCKFGGPLACEILSRKYGNA